MSRFAGPRRPSSSPTQREERRNTALFNEVVRKREAQSEIHREANRLRRKVTALAENTHRGRRVNVPADDFSEWISVLSHIETISDGDGATRADAAARSASLRKRADDLAIHFDNNVDPIPTPPRRRSTLAARRVRDDACSNYCESTTACCSFAVVKGSDDSFRFARGDSDLVVGDDLFFDDEPSSTRRHSAPSSLLEGRDFSLYHDDALSSASDGGGVDVGFDSASEARQPTVVVCYAADKPAEGRTRYSCHVDAPANCAVS